MPIIVSWSRPARCAADSASLDAFRTRVAAEGEGDKETEVWYADAKAGLGIFAEDEDVVAGIGAGWDVLGRRAMVAVAIDSLDRTRSKGYVAPKNNE